MDAPENPSLQRLRPRPFWRFAKHALRLMGVAVPVLLFAQYAVFGSSGYLALHRKRAVLQAETAKLDALKTQNQQLNQAVVQLKSDRETIESIAHRQYHLVRPNEVVLTYTPLGTKRATLAAK